MKQSASIFVKGIQSVDGESDCIELSSEGTVELNDKGLRLCYYELSENDEKSETVLTLIGETLKIDRNGSNEMSMIIQKNKHRSCTLDTPMGALLIGTYGKSLSHENAVLKCSYDLDMNSVLMSTNELEITYQTDNER